MTTVTTFDKDDIVFVVEQDNTFIGVITGESYFEVIEIRPIYMKRFVNTISLWVDQKYIQSCLGTDEISIREEYAEYFI